MTRLLLVMVAVCLLLPRPAWAEDQYEGPTYACPEPIDSNEATLTARAREHYERATELYERGEYEAAIREFTAVYCLIGLDSAAFSIALSYVNLVDYENALRWYWQFVRTTKDPAKRASAANRIDRIRKLPARVSVSTQPPGARVTLTSDQEKIEGRADDKEPLRVQAGTYTLRVTMDGFETAEQQITVKIGQPYSYSFRLNEQQGAVRITTNPLNARIFVDDRLVAVGTYVADLPIGRHKVSVEAEGRKPKVQDIEVDEIGTTTVFIKLAPPLRSGRWELISGMTALGAASGGGLGATVFAQNRTGASLTTAGAAGLAFAGGYLGVRENIPVGHTSWIIGGAVWGAVEGATLAVSFSDDDSVVSSSAFAGLITGVVASTLSVKRVDPSAGDSALINSGGLWGSVGGVMLWTLFRNDENGNIGRDRDLGPFVLAGLNTGLLAGVSLAYRYEYTRGHIALIDLAGLGGMLTGAALYQPFTQATDVGTADTPLHFVFGGMLLGLVTGAWLTQNMDVEKVPAAVTAAVPSVGMTRTLAGETLPTLQWSGTW
jgi:PEGA domain